MNDQETPQGTSVSPQEREEFLRQHGWDEQLPAGQREAIENRWSDTDIAMARQLGF